MATALTFRESAKTFLDSISLKIAHSPATNQVATIALVIIAAISYQLRKTRLTQHVDNTVDFFCTERGTKEAKDADKKRRDSLNKLLIVDLTCLASFSITPLIYEIRLFPSITSKLFHTDLSPKTKVVSTIAFGVIAAICYYQRYNTFEAYSYCEHELLNESLSKFQRKQNLDSSRANYARMYRWDCGLLVSLMTIAILGKSILRK